MDYAILAATFSALGIAFLHYAPWHLTIGKVLPRLVAYALGVLAIAVPATWAMLNGAEGIRTLWFCIIAAGAVDALCYGWDWINNKRHKVLTLEEKVNALEQGENAAG